MTKNKKLSDNKNFLNPSSNELIVDSPYIDIDLFDFKSPIEKYNKIIDSMMNKSVLAIKGYYGSGKSTMLNLLKNGRAKTNANEKWILFDSWKYSNKDNLWEGFLLDLINNFEGSKGVKNIIKKIDAHKTKIRKISELADNPINSIKKLGALISSVMTGNPFLGKAIDIFPDNVLSKITSTLDDNYPIKRDIELQNLITEILNQSEFMSFVIIIEDIDRSDDSGVFFLETLKYFITNTNIHKNIKIVVPVSPEFIEPNNIDVNHNDEFFSKIKLEYEKIFDYVESFHIKDINIKSYVKVFINENQIDLKPEQKKIYCDQLMEFFNEVLKNESKITIRSIKKIFAKANYIYSICNIEEKDFRIILALSFYDYLNPKRLPFITTKKSILINTANSPLKTLLFSIDQNKVFEKDTQFIYDYYFEKEYKSQTYSQPIEYLSYFNFNL